MKLDPSTPWLFYCFLSARGVDEIDAWYQNLSKKAKANFQRTREHLSALPQTEWDRPHASPLGNHIYVIRFKDETRAQHRAFGNFIEKHHAFVITLTGTEKDGNYDPSGYKETCAERATISIDKFEARCKRCFSRESGSDAPNHNNSPKPDSSSSVDDEAGMGGPGISPGISRIIH